MSMTTITPYLFFAGRCDEAIEFYQSAVGAKLEMLMRFSESPEPTPPGMLQSGFENKVMHATITVGGATIMLSDGCDDKSHFDGFRLALAYATESEARAAFDALSKNGKVQMPLTKTFWSPCFGMLTDAFGVAWMVSVLTPPTTNT